MILFLLVNLTISAVLIAPSAQSVTAVIIICGRKKWMKKNISHIFQRNQSTPKISTLNSLSLKNAREENEMLFKDYFITLFLHHHYQAL